MPVTYLILLAMAACSSEPMPAGPGGPEQRSSEIPATPISSPTAETAPTATVGSPINGAIDRNSVQNDGVTLGTPSDDASPSCHEDLGFGRVEYVPETGACVILDKVIVRVDDNYTVDQAAGLEKMPGWSVIGKLSGVRMVLGGYSPDNLTLQQLEEQAALIAEQDWAMYAETDALVGIDAR